MPDDVVFVDALSYGATGKIQKMELAAPLRRTLFAGHRAGRKGTTA
jgi:fatty-acyl-CoA synthase